MVKLSYELFGFILLMVSGLSLFIGILIDKPSCQGPKKTIDDLEFQLKRYQSDVRRLQAVIKTLRSRAESEVEAEAGCQNRSARHYRV